MTEPLSKDQPPQPKCICPPVQDGPYHGVKYNPECPKCSPLCPRCGHSAHDETGCEEGLSLGMEVDDGCNCPGPAALPAVTQPMTDAEFEALTIAVRHETVMHEEAVRKYGEIQFDPWTPAVRALCAELEKRGIVQCQKS